MSSPASKLRQRLDRVSFNVDMYAATGNNEKLRSAQNTIVQMHVGAAALQDLASDNPFEEVHVRELDTAIDRLGHALEVETPSNAVPEKEILACRSVISLLQDRERDLLHQRSVESETSTNRNLIAGAAFTAFSLTVILVLFGFLIRDAIRRRVFERELCLSNDELAATVEQLKDRANDAGLRKAARDELQLCVTTKEAQRCVVRHIQEIVTGSRGALMMINNSRNMLEITESWDNPASLADGCSLESCCAVRMGRTRWRRPGESEVNCSHFTDSAPENYICIPLAAQGETLGLVYLDFPTPEVAALADSRMPVVVAMVELASMAIAGLELRARLEAQSIRDGLTGLFNRRFMEIALERELHRAARKGVPLALMMLDVDHFKNFNDNFGHEAGDAVLREAANCFLACVRAEDIVCRYGGEEFIIILPEITRELAVERAEQIRRAVGNLKVQFKARSLNRISISVGMAMYPDPVKDAEELLRMADRALYEAKHAGRDQLQIAPELFEVIAGS
jgi:diguanylate cyclase (GGDEF)-like protein